MEKIVKTVDSENGITIFNAYGKITTKDLKDFPFETQVFRDTPTKNTNEFFHKA